MLCYEGEALLSANLAGILSWDRYEIVSDGS
jgi:hypothetical protein